MLIFQVLLVYRCDKWQRHTYLRVPSKDIIPPVSSLSSTVNSTEGTEAKVAAGFASVGFWPMASFLFWHVDPKENIWLRSLSAHVARSTVLVVNTYILESAFQGYYSSSVKLIFHSELHRRNRSKGSCWVCFSWILAHGFISVLACGSKGKHLVKVTFSACIDLLY